MKKKLFTFLTLLVAIVTGAWASTVDNLTPITAPCTITMDGINGTDALVAGTLYSSNRLLSLGSGSGYDGKNKGTTTYDEVAYKNVYQIKNNRQIALKIAFNAVITVVGNSHSSRSWRIGTTSAGNEIADGGNNSTTASGGVNGSVVSPVTVYINASGDLYIGAIIIKAPAVPGAVTFSPETGSSVNAGSSITLSAKNATGYKYKWSNSTATPAGDWTTGSTATVPEFGSENVYLHAYGTSAAGNGESSYAQYTITQPKVATPTFSPSSSSFTSASIDVTIACATTDYDAIMYSFDNSTWTEYTGAITINTSKKIYAKATKTGYIDSDVAFKKYVKQDAGTSGSANDLGAVSTGYTFIAESIIPGAGKLSLDNKIYTTKQNTVKSDKGSSTIGGESYPNCLRLRKGEDVVFKTDGPCLLTLYCSTNNTNDVCAGSEAGGDQYGSYTTAIADGTREFIIPAAGTVYVTGSGDNADWCIAGFTLTEIPTTTVTTNAGKWASFTPSWNATLESGATAYIITDVSETTITATAVNVLKAGEGYFIKGAGKTTSYTATATATAADATTGNLLVGQLEATTINASTPDTNTKFVLGTTAGEQSGLFKVTSDVTVAAGKAYLNAKKIVEANSLSLDFSDVTGIQTIKAQKELLEGDFYNLKGQKVAQPTKGLYIVNGKKVIIK